MGGIFCYSFYFWYNFKILYNKFFKRVPSNQGGKLFLGHFWGGLFYPFSAYHCPEDTTGHSMSAPRRKAQLPSFSWRLQSWPLISLSALRGRFSFWSPPRDNILQYIETDKKQPTKSYGLHYKSEGIAMFSICGLKCVMTHTFCKNLV